MSTDWLARIRAYVAADLSVETRERIMRPLALAAVIAFTPVMLQNAWLGHWSLASFIALVQFLLVVNYRAMCLHRPPPIPHELVAIPAAVAVVGAIFVHGIVGLFWTFSIVLYAHFVLRRPLALLVSAAFFVFVVAISVSQFGAAVAIRAALSLLITIMLINIVLDALVHVQRKMLDLTATDALTGAANRRNLEASLVHAAARATRSGAPQTLLLFDIDHFKDINDLHGHSVGDQVLRQLVELVNQRAREVDLLFRIGGEEFLLLATDTRLGDGLVLAEALRREVTNASWPQQHPVTISLGVAEYVAGESWEAWIKRADVALYRAKHAGRNAVAG
ncbi:MAG TPA: GGDEF domain-containing protein [Usitatibacteraceae bacterium]|nr:GGDEF domain-containing protein [Usitatibacteraceae bacterium]